MIKIESIHKSFGAIKVIENFNLQVEKGEVHILLGASGSGKTTLLRIIGGIERPDQGNVTIEGLDTSKMGARERTTKLSYVTQEGGLFPHLSARQNIILPATIRKKDLSQINRKLEKLCTMVNLDFSFLDKYPHQLSGGQRQRVALVRGLILDPEIVLLDEPLSALDPIVRLSLQKELKQIFSALNKTVIMVTHDIQEASFLGTKVTLLNQGRAVQTGVFKELYKNPNDPFVKEFLQAQIPVEMMNLN